MLEEAIPSFLASFHTWLTPTVLFVLLNVVIGTIAVTSKASRREDGGPNPTAAANESVGAKLSRSSSAFLHRIRSFNINLDRLHLPTENPLDQIQTPPLPPAPATDPNEPDPTPNDEIHHHLSRSHKSGEIDTNLAEQMKKPAGEKPHFEHFEEAEIFQHADSIVGDQGTEVDARADDFINRFRQQLKLQRLESIIRYKSTVG
ncbi:hypothetical protein IEQ34_004334 [Dendrobium chrysotoxum]|uniref:DUF4408 domain-containing protein n=1 Tax=Dendrobium chrysotoxum TaxID=161865 RepID=A0AAV7HDR7_DENCH|nr:hypothetical protein IEQ34_004334 [Dendrobium chrysotoxum]